MSIADESKRTYQRFQVYIEALRNVFSQHGISGASWSDYLRAYRLLKDNHWVRDKVLSILKDAATLEGGKLSLTTVGLILGLAIGGIGIAGMGSAIGIPAFLVTAVGGLLGGIAGQEVDALRMDTSAGIQSVDSTPFFALPAEGSSHSDHSEHSDIGDAGNTNEELRAIRLAVEAVWSEMRTASSSSKRDLDELSRRIAAIERRYDQDHSDSSVMRSQVLSTTDVLRREVQDFKASIADMSDKLDEVARTAGASRKLCVLLIVLTAITIFIQLMRVVGLTK